MQTKNKILDDLSQLMTNAMGVAQGARDEATNAIRSVVDRLLADRDLVTRAEFEAVRAMAQKAREENTALKARLDAMAGPSGSPAGVQSGRQSGGAEPEAKMTESDETPGAGPTGAAEAPGP